MAPSVENSPFALALVQLVILVVNAILYSRQKSALDVEKRDRGAFHPLVQQAVADATAARRGTEQIEVDHYKRLHSLLSSIATEHEADRAKLRAMEESVSSLSNKLASRDRADAAAAKRAAKPSQEREDVVPVDAGAVDMDSLLRAHGVPVGPPAAAPEAVRPPGFGVMAGRRS